MSFQVFAILLIMLGLISLINNNLSEYKYKNNVSLVIFILFLMISFGLAIKATIIFRQNQISFSIYLITITILLVSVILRINDIKRNFKNIKS